jgi:hypothetical protein
MSNVAKYALENPDAIKDMCKNVRKEIKWAATQAVNAVAFESRENLKNRVKAEFINRNSFTTSGNALFVTKAAFGHTENLGEKFTPALVSRKRRYICVGRMREANTKALRETIWLFPRTRPVKEEQRPAL